MKIEWNKVTRYSRVGSVLLFLVVVAVLVFYIGIQYKKTQILSSQEKITIATPDMKPNVNQFKTYKNEKYGFEFKYLSDLAYTEEILNGKDLVVHFSKGAPGYSLIVTVSPIDDFILASGQTPSYYEKNTNELVTYDSVLKKKVISREKSSFTSQGWKGFYVFSTLVIPNKKTGYTISIDESASPEDVRYLDDSPVKESFILL